MTDPAPAPARFKLSPLDYCLAAVPVAVVLHYVEADPVLLFVVSCVAIIPLAGLMGRATENLSQTMGPGVGGLLNATFGNAAELIIAIMALAQVPHDVSEPENAEKAARMLALVKASMTGSIVGNVLLVLGASIVAGGLFYKKQTFNRTASSMGATLLALAALGLLIPAAFWELSGAARDPKRAEEVARLSEEISAVLLLVYGLSLLFSLRTHRHLFAGEEGETTGEPGEPEWSRKRSLVVLLLATVGVGVVAEYLVGSVEHAGKEMGLTPVFIGVIVVAIVGNAAEHSTAVMVAVKNKMDLAVNIAITSSIQIALFVAPVLVFTSLLMGHAQPLDLHFTPMETLAVLAAVAVLALVAQDGETHWMEGVMLLAVYGMIALAFYHLPEPR